MGQGFYIVWPILGPSSPRDSVSIAGDYFLYPVSYISPWYAWLGVRTYEEVNATSLRIGDYEALKDAAIDPYVAFRDAYIQYRMKKVKARKAKLASIRTAQGAISGGQSGIAGKGKLNERKISYEKFSEYRADGIINFYN